MSSPPVPSLEDWLESVILLPQYLDVLRGSGYDTLHKCAVLTPSDLDHIGILLPGHKKRILSQLARFHLELPECRSNDSAKLLTDVASPGSAGDISSQEVPTHAASSDATVADSP